MTVRVSNTRPWARAGIVLLHVWLVAVTGARAASASDTGEGGPEDASAAPVAPAALDVSSGAATPDGPDVYAAGTLGTPLAETPPPVPQPVATAARTTRFAQASPDFAFGRPRFSIGVRGLMQRPRATGDFHAFVHESFFARTSPEDDVFDPETGLMNFDATGVGLDVGFGVGSRLEARVGVDYALVRALTEDRFNEDEFGLPIEQTTELAQWGIQGDVALALTPRGRAIGQYVWIPSAVIPYVGAGVGLVRYRTLMTGRFVDVFDYTIFSDTIESQGWAPSVHAFGGVDFRLTGSVLLTTEARYSWAAAELDGAFAGYEHDLTGLRISAGVRFVF